MKSRPTPNNWSPCSTPLFPAMPNHPMENSTLSPSAYRNDLPTSKKVPLATTKLKPTTNPLVTLVNNHPDLPLAKSPQIKHHSISSPKSPWGSSNNAASQQQQTQAHSRSQQQAQAALQAHAQHSQQAMPNWYPNMNAQPTPEMMGFGPQQPFDINFDFTQFDLGTGSDADLSALFIPDSMAMWSYPTDPNMQGYNGF